MRLAPVVLLHLLAALLATARSVPQKDFAARQYFVVEIDSATSNEHLHGFIAAYNDTFRFEHPVRGLDDHYVFSVDRKDGHMAVLGNHRTNNDNLLKRAEGHEQRHDALLQQPGLRLIEMLYPRKLERRMPVPIDDGEMRMVELAKKRFTAVDSLQAAVKEVSEKLLINDPIFAEQWHLVNSQYPGNDVNVKNVWYAGNRGKGVTVAVIDDGLDYETDDLKNNFNAKGLWDFNDDSQLPKPRLFDDYHGTRCAGEIAAVKNDVCGVGVAYEAKVAGIRILSGPITSEQEAAAMIYGLDENDIYSCSWGPTDNGRTVAAPDMLVKKAMVKGVQEGRGNKGVLYVFASGNGGRVGDQCNFDGYTNSIYSITVGAIDYKGLHPKYAETCSAVMVVTYSSGSGEHIHTTDIHKKCSATHGGTSAAAPLAAGLYALALNANPELTWRDAQYVSAMAAVPVHEEDGDYQVTGLGQKYSHKYGYGNLDAEKLVEAAKTWTNVKPQAWHYADVVTADLTATAPADKESEPVVSTVTITEADLKVMNVERLEHVTVTVNIDSNNRGKIGVNLVSPFGVVSKLAWYRELDQVPKGLTDWTFLSVAHWGESGVGEWKLEVFSYKDNEVHLNNWQLRFFGESIDADKAEKYDITKDYAQVRRERLAEAGDSTTTAAEPATTEEPTTEEPTTSAVESAETTEPAETTAETTDAATSAEAGTTATSSTELATKPTEEPTEEEPVESEEPENHEGANKHYTTDHAGQYFMALAVVGFLIFLVIMKWHRKPGSSRRRRRGDFEFDIIPGEDYSDSDEERDTMELQTRSQEDVERDRLYDEFNAESLPGYENDMFQIGDEDEHDKGVAEEATASQEASPEADTPTDESAPASGSEQQ